MYVYVLVCFSSKNLCLDHLNMKFIICAAFFCLFAAVHCQTQHKNGNPTGEIGQPAFDEIIVESTLTVRGKSGARSGKSLITNVRSAPKMVETSTVNVENAKEAKESNPIPSRIRRSPQGNAQRYGGIGGVGGFAPQPLVYQNPSSSSSAAQASSSAFNNNSPFGSFGGSASQSSSQSQNFGPDGFRGGAGHSASQTYHLPNGHTISVSYSNSYNVENGKPNFANSQSITITSPDGTVRKLIG